MFDFDVVTDSPEMARLKKPEPQPRHEATERSDALPLPAAPQTTQHADPVAPE